MSTIVCIVVATVINCTVPATAPVRTPESAVKVLTSGIAPFVAPLELPERDLRPHKPDPLWPFKAPATPILPLSEPWRVTTVFTTNNGVKTYFNGVLVR